MSQRAATTSTMAGFNKSKSKPGFDDSCRSGATHLDCSIDCSDRSAIDGCDFFDGRSKLTRSCLLVKTQQDSLKQLSTSELKEAPSRRSSSETTISFDKVTLRTYDVIVTDNPSTTAGPPIGLGWLYDETQETYDVDAYENCRQPRSKKEFLLPSSERWEMLQSAGVPPSELRKASQEVKERQAQRKISLRRQERMELVASAIRCIEHIVPGRKGKHQ
mmetsp:Transcript_18521/g.30328  ORF Transcript_18521/g.30328 Transcript_18521/m.30328 type:complete len:218 (-) Transcript_18521:71-724(-)